MTVLTILGFWLGIGLILTYEFYAFHQQQGKTISEIVWRISVTHPLVPCCFGVLIGHFFWQSTWVYLGRCH